MNVTIQSNGYTVTVCSFGAELKSFRNPAGKEFVWNSDPTYWMRSSPLLFPTIGNLRNNQTIINGNTYEMARHGFCKDSEFEVVNQSESTVSFLLAASEETKKSYPFDFKLVLTYELNGNALSMTYDITNDDTTEMPYHIGAHPGFMFPVDDNDQFEDYVLQFEKEERLESVQYDLEQMEFNMDRKVLYSENGNTIPLCKDMFDHDAVYFPHTNSRSVSLINPKTQKGIRMDYPDFKSIAFWTPAGGNAPFLCLEPWNGSAICSDEDDEFIHKRDMEFLEPNTSNSYSLKITLLGE